MQGNYSALFHSYLTLIHSNKGIKRKLGHIIWVKNIPIFTGKIEDMETSIYTPYLLPL